MDTWRVRLQRVVYVLVFTDTTTIRVMLGWGSLLWTIGLWMPLSTFDRPGFAWMRFVAPGWFWGLLFLVHAAGVAWRIVDSRSRPNWAFVVNALGFVIWTGSTTLLTLAVGEFTPAAGLEWVLCVASAVALVRTGLNDEIVSP